MSSHKRVNVVNIVASSTMSSTSLIYSQPIDTRYVDNIGVMVKWTGTPSGSFFRDVSANYVQDITGTANTPNNPPGDWFPPTTSFTQAIASSGIASQEFNQSPYPWQRIRYVPSSASSSGVLNIWVATKEV